MPIQSLHSPFHLVSDFKPTGDQPRAIDELTEGLLRGDPHQTLLGATGTGKSVGYDDPVFVVEHRDGQPIPRLLPIGKLVDEAMTEMVPRRVGDSDVLDLPANRFSTLAYDPATGQVGLHPVSAFTRHETPATMYRLRTTCGREITLTGDHNLWVLREGHLRLIETAEARPTDCIPLPETLPAPSGRQHLDLLPLLKEEKLYVDAQPSVLQYEAEAGTTVLARSLSMAGVTSVYPKLYALRGREKARGGLRTDTLVNLLSQTQNLGGFWKPETAFVRGSIGGHPLPLRLTLTPAFLRLIGYYVAEGNSQRVSNYIVLANRDPEVRAEVEEALSEPGVPFSVRASTDYQISSAVLTRLLSRLCGSKARTKRLPSFWPQLSNDALAHLLRAYFDGDGTVGHASDVTATTASTALASDLTYALLRFGIWARIRRKHKRATNSNHTGDTYFEVSLSGQDNLERFADQIGFGLPRKQEALREQRGRPGNSNVDVVPVDGTMLRRLRQALGVTAKAAGALAGVSRSAIQLYEKNERRPNRHVLRRLLDGLSAQARQQKANESWWTTWQHLHRLCDVQWTPIASVESVTYPHRFVYDFTVPGPETFLAGTGGLFVHNTFAISNVIRNVGKPTLVISHNKTLAAQLYAEFRQFFPNNAVEFFISYYDYYQPEAYIVTSDTYIEKDFAINDEIDRLRLRATSSLVSGRKDVIIVASVSCIYGLGNPEEYKARIVQLQTGQTMDRDDMLRQLVHIFYTRNDIDFTPGTFRVRGDVVDVLPAYYESEAYRIAFWGDEIERISRFDPVSGKIIAEEAGVTIYPAKHFVTPEDQMQRAIAQIEEELRWRLAVLRDSGKLLEAQRLEQRTLFDIEMMKEVGYCSGIENYSRHMDGREPGSRPHCLFDYFPEDFLLVIDESHVTIPQIRAMYNGDRARKLVLVEHGFRLPSALDNRPLKFEEFEGLVNQAIFVSATPSDYELEKSGGVIVEQIIRPTGILDPPVEVRPIAGQIDDLLDEVQERVKRRERVLVTTLTKRMSEDLTEYLESFGVRVRYLHSDIDALERVDILRDLRLGEFDVLVGVNLLREGLDLPEVSLVAVLDADKEGFLRSERSLIQTAGRAARNVNGKVIFYADRMTGSMERMIEETERRRAIQQAYNEEHGIVPQTVRKSLDQIRAGTVVADHKAEQDARRQSVTYYSGPEQLGQVADPVVKYLTDDQKKDLIAQLRKEMIEASENLEFERAAELRDAIAQIEAQLQAA